MNSSFTPAQQKQLDTWSERRDGLLREIGLFTTERDDRKKEADAEALRLTDIHRSISEAEGRIAVLDRLEEVKKNSVSVELSELLAHKSRLEAETRAQDEKLKASKEEYESISAATTTLCNANGVVRDQREAITSILSQIKTTSVEHLSEAKEIVATTKAISDTVIDRANENLSQTKIIIEKLPKFIFELQRPIPVRRIYPADHPKEHLNERPS